MYTCKLEPQLRSQKGFKVATVDINRSPNMNINSDAGFVSLELILAPPDLVWLAPHKFFSMALCYRLVLWIILNERESAFNLMGPDCASWGLPNRGTSKRDFINWRGADGLPYVAAANVMIGRSLSCTDCQQFTVLG